MTSDELSLAQELCRLSGRCYAIATGRGATAIYIGLRAAGLSAARVVVPGTICSAAVCPIIYSGNEPVFCDVELSDLNVGVARVREALLGGAECAIIPHAYGHAARIGEIASACAEHGAMLVEDAASALGATPDGRLAGSWGSFSVFSFGYAKVVDAGIGGALLTDERGLFRAARRELARLPERTAEHSIRSASLGHILRGWLNARRAEPRLDAMMQPVWSHYSDVHLLRLGTDDHSRIADRLPSLPAALEARSRNADLYDRLLGAGDVDLFRPQPRPGSVCWRYTLLLPPLLRDTVVDSMRGAGVDVSTLYPSAQRLFGDMTSPELPNCREVENRAINLWASPDLTDQDIARNVTVLRDAMARVRAQLGDPK